MAYTFANPENTSARRDDGAFVPWNPALNQPLDIGGSVGRRWIADGSPIPNPYVAPPPTADELRTTAFKSDPDRATLISHFKSDSLAQLETFVRNQINADGVTNLATAQTCLKRLETSQVILFKALALILRD